jgi:uncharacterized membrane protein (UPF0127 family)
MVSHLKLSKRQEQKSMVTPGVRDAGVLPGAWESMGAGLTLDYRAINMDYGIPTDYGNNYADDKKVDSKIPNKNIKVWKFDDGDFTFWTAHYDMWGMKRKAVFRVRTDSDPKTRAAEKAIKYHDRIEPSTQEEILEWMKTHKQYKPLNLQHNAADNMPVFDKRNWFDWKANIGLHNMNNTMWYQILNDLIPLSAPNLSEKEVLEWIRSLQMRMGIPPAQFSKIKKLVDDFRRKNYSRLTDYDEVENAPADLLLFLRLWSKTDPEWIEYNTAKHTKTDEINEADDKIPTLATLRRIVKAVGAKLVNESSGLYIVWQIEAPEGKHWEGGAHSISVEWLKGIDEVSSGKVDAIKDAINRMKHGLVDCLPDCECFDDTNEVDDAERMNKYKKHNSTLPENVLSGIKLTNLGKVKNFNIWVVNGKYIRDNIDIDFTTGGNPGRYEYIPENEIWIDNSVEQDEIEDDVLHEIDECLNMEIKGETYDKAHDEASGLEKELRDESKADDNYVNTIGVYNDENKGRGSFVGSKEEGFELRHTFASLSKRAFPDYPEYSDPNLYEQFSERIDSFTTPQFNLFETYYLDDTETTEDKKDQIEAFDDDAPEEKLVITVDEMKKEAMVKTAISYDANPIIQQLIAIPQVKSLIEQHASGYVDQIKVTTTVADVAQTQQQLQSTDPNVKLQPISGNPFGHVWIGENSTTHEKKPVDKIVRIDIVTDLWGTLITMLHEISHHRHPTWSEAQVEAEAQQLAGSVKQYLEGKNANRKKILFVKNGLHTVLLEELEIADTYQKQVIGLQNHNSLGHKHGLLFPYHTPQALTFHMGKVSFPIDIIFANDNKIVKIYRNCQPNSREMYSCDKASKVIEVIGSYCTFHDIDVGDHIFEVDDEPHKHGNFTQHIFERIKEIKTREQKDLDMTDWSVKIVMNSKPDSRRFMKVNWDAQDYKLKKADIIVNPDPKLIDVAIKELPLEKIVRHALLHILAAQKNELPEERERELITNRL